MNIERVIDRVKNKTNYSKDIIYKKIFIGNRSIYLIFNEVLCDGKSINEFVLCPIIKYKNTNKNIIPCNNIINVLTSDSLIDYLNKGFCILIDKRIVAIELRNNLDRSIDKSNTEESILGPKDSFNECFNTNIGLIRKRIRSSKLVVDSLYVGKLSNTKVGILYIDNITDKDLLIKVKNKIDKIDIDGIIDSNYIRRYLSSSIFPTINISERPDLASISLLEGKIVIVVDNSPYVLILPTFFLDFFHTSDDYYEKDFNISFIRFIRLISFFISIFIPGIYISLTTFNINFIPTLFLHNLLDQRILVPFPSFIECFILLLCFEILRETDLRSPSKISSSTSILGGLILGEASVKAGIISPMMIIVIAISSISGLIFSNVSIIYLIRYLRIFILILSTILGIYGVFIGYLIIIIKLCKINTFNYPYMYPLSPFNKKLISDSFIKYNTHPKYRNNLLTKNIIRGK